jgi:hypothetical protein
MQTVRLFALLIAALFASRSEAEPSAFALHGQFERGATPDEMRFVFQLQPAPPRAPVVWLAAAAPHGERATLPVSYDRASGRYAAAFRLSPRSGEGTLQVELSDGAVRVSELHAVAIAVREHATTGPMSRSSVEGNFSVYTTPDALPQGAQVVVATLELPLQPLPRGVARADVLSVHAVALTGGAASATPDWKVAASDPRPRPATPSLLFLPEGGTSWTSLAVTVLPAHALAVAGFAGPGTYLLVGRVLP